MKNSESIHHQPRIFPIERIDIPEVMNIQNNTGIPIFYVPGGTHEISKIDCIFPAGRKYELQNAVARTTCDLLVEGTTTKTFDQIAYLLDFYGFKFKASSDFDHAYISIVCLSKYFDIASKLLFEIIFNPTFRESELEKFALSSKSKLEQQLQKNEFVVYRKFTESIFGKDHVYGYNTDPNDFLKLKREDVLDFHAKHYRSDKMKIILSGKVSNQDLRTLNQLLDSQNVNRNVEGTNFIYTPPVTSPEKISLKANQEFQATIKIGRRTFKRNHHDYIGLYFLNTVLGGYFGSRLMKSVREKHGYSYNIHSYLEQMQDDGYFVVGTEVGIEYVEKTIEAVEIEMNILKNSLIQTEEFEMVRNYILGTILNNLDGPFATANTLKELISQNLDMNTIKVFAEGIKNQERELILQLAQTYLCENTLTTTIAS